MNEKLHPTQAKLLNIALSEGLDRFTLDELAKQVSLKSRQAVWHHLCQLEKRGFIDLISKKSVKDADSPVLKSIPILGLADCGQATQIAEEKIQGYIRVSAGFVGQPQKELFAVMAVGDSMNIAKVPCRSGGKKSIEDGDFIIIDPSVRRPLNNDYVLSVIDGAANIKRFYSDNEKVVLFSESSNEYSPIIIHPDDIRGYMVNGKVIDVIKRPNLDNKI